MHTLPNYLEYAELFDEFTFKELKQAYKSLSNSDLQDELYETESPLLVFLVDTKKQDQLVLFFDDRKNGEIFIESEEMDE
jgi:hypothetical protein